MDDIGKICQYSSCRIRDFLPIQCDKCKKYYCVEHQKCIHHECPLNHNHNIINNKLSSKIKKYKCRYPNCKKHNKVKISCLHCKLNFCPTHIAYDIHKCHYK